MKKDIVKIITEIGIFAGIGFVLDEIQGAYSVTFTSGGSIGIAMIAVLIIAYRRGLLPAVLTGMIIGLFDFATKAYVVHPVQVLLDYIFPYAFVGLSGLYKPLFDKTDNRNLKVLWLILGTLTGGILKFFSHFFAGYFFWNNPDWFAWDLNYMNPALYSFVYNIAYIGPSIIISAALLIVLFLKAPKILMTEGESVTYIQTKEKNSNKIKYTICGSLIAAGLFLFVYYLIRYIQSFEGDLSNYLFNEDCMIMFLFGIALVLLAINNIAKIIIGKFKYSILSLVFGLLILGLSMYGLSQVIKMYLDDDKAYDNLYWIWLFIPLFISSLFVFLYFLLKRKEDMQMSSISAN